jgi:modulator of FtsH protease
MLAVVEAWANFFVTSAGAAATLAGLVIVAVSVNIQQILKHPQLPPRAGATIATLVLVLMAGVAALMPQSTKLLGGEVVLFAVVGWLPQLLSLLSIIPEQRKSGRPMYELWFGVPGGHIVTLAMAIGGALLLSGDGDGIYWVAGSILGAFVFAMLNAWVLLVEILR